MAKSRTGKRSLKSNSLSLHVVTTVHIQRFLKLSTSLGSALGSNPGGGSSNFAMLGGISPSSTQRAGALPVRRRSRPLARSLHALANCKALSIHQQSHNFATACHSTPPGTKFDSTAQHIVPGIVHCRLVPGHTGGNASIICWNSFCRRYIHVRRGG